ncbi:MAG: hypothetical protein K6C97_00325 [Treponema sp.]|nr:hypothetical protein [Treponema sp.]
MLNFVTLFDKNYMSRGIVLYNSLKENCKQDFTLYVLAMDNQTAEYLKNLNHQNLVVFTVEDTKVMYPVLEKLQKERTRAEFSWTLSSFSIQYCLRQFNLDSCTYIDSDICFYNDPQILIDELNGKSVMITEHRYTPEYDLAAINGKFCVQFMYFKNDDEGNKVLEYWRSSCQEWCYNRNEDGKFGDQMYLNDWESRFASCVYNCHNPGCGLAPWNVQQYKIVQKEEKLYVEDLITKVQTPIVFYHYHELKEYAPKKWCLTHYRLTSEQKEILYKPYIQKLYAVEEKYPQGLITKTKGRLQNSLYKKIKRFLGYLKRYPAYAKGRTESFRNIITF